MALAAVSSVINSTLVPLLSSEVNLLGNINREVASIKAELESIMSFLKDVDSTPIKNERAKNWVKQVRELAYQIEDVMDEYVLHLAENRQRRGFIGFLRKLARSITKLKPQHDIATQIQGIKQNIRDIKERADRYAFDSLEPASSSKTEEKLHDDPRVASLFIEEDEVVGIESTREELIHRLITGKSNRTVTSLVGMGGCGKTTLAKKVFDNRKVIEHFDCQAWVSVSQSYKMEDIFRRMIKELFQTTNECAPPGIDTMDQNSLIHMLREFLLKKRYLIVFDDVWSADFWRLVKLALPKNNKGSQIIVTTRKEDVASFCKESSWDHICKVKPLIKEEAWKLFCMKAFQRDFDGCCPPELETVSRAILKKCEGTLAIVIIGALLSTKSKDASEWQKFYDSLGSQMERNQHLTNVTKILLLSYHDLPYYLKPCFLYFGIIPEDYQITRGRLIRLWIAEGFIEGQKGKTLEEVAEEWLTELIHRSLVQVSEKKLDGRIKSCRVHDLVHEIILVKCEELGFCQVLREAYPSWDNETRRWSMQMRNVTEKGWWETMSSTKSKIRSVFVFSVGEFPKLQFLGTLAGNFKLVKVLDLQGAPLYQLHEEVGNLLHLRYLSVKRTKVKIIPKSIGNLHNLQTLNLACSRVSVLQIGILSRLRKLRHLIGNYMMEIQGGIGHLEELQTLKIIMANDDLIKELENLRQLRKLDIRDVKREHVKALCTAIEKMNHLQSLAVESIQGNTILDLHSLSSPPKSLQRLNLFVRLEMLPNWISRLDNLVSLHLHSGLTGAHAIKALQVLPNLIQLYFSHGYDGEQLYFDVGGFPKLKRLYLQCSGRLNSVIIEEGGLPVLEDLRIEGFPQLKEVPSSIRNLTKLKSLIFIDLMPTEFYDRMRPDKGQDYWVIEHIPIVKFYWDDGRGNRAVHTPREFQDVRESMRLKDESQEVGGVE